MSLVKFSSVGLRYSTGPEVLHDVNFELEEGTFHFLTGSSGAGKTSLMIPLDQLIVIDRTSKSGDVRVGVILHLENGLPDLTSINGLVARFCPSEMGV